MGTFGKTFEYIVLTIVVAGLGPPKIILFWFLKSSIEFASV